MSKYYDRSGLPLNPTYMGFLLGNYGGRTIRNKKSRKEAIKLWTEKDAKDAEAAKEVEAAFKALGEARAAEAKAAAEANSAEEAKAAEAKAAEKAKVSAKAKAGEGAPKWDEVQDKALLAMKSQGIDWKDIAVIMGVKDKHAVKARYKELIATKDKENVGVGKGDEKGEEGKKQKEGKGKEGKGKEKEKELKGILKNGSSDGGATEHKKSDAGSPSNRSNINLFFGEDDELTKEDLTLMFRINEHCDKKKWVEMASKLFDKTGKRIAPELLERKLSPLSSL